MAEKTWRKRLTEAKKRGSFVTEDENAANSWNTCAVGEHEGEFRLAYFRQPGAGPLSVGLRTLGLQFAHAVTYRKTREANALYKQIQAWFRRSAKRRKARQEA